MESQRSRPPRSHAPLGRQALGRRRGPLRRGGLALLAGLALVAIALPAAAAAPIAPELLQRVRSEGVVRVIATLDADEVPQHAPSAERQRGRDRIRSLRDAAAAALAPGVERRERDFADLPYLALDADEADLWALAGSAEVVAIDEDTLLYPSLTSSEPVIGAVVTRDAGFTGSGQVVAVLDTGVDLTHPAFAGKATSEACYSATSSCPNGQKSQLGPGSAVPCVGPSDCFHGTHVSGIAVGGGSPTGIAPDAGLIAIRVFSVATGTDCTGAGQDPCAVAYTSDVIAGLARVETLASSFSIAAVNMSFGGGKWTSAATCDAQNSALKSEVGRVLALGIASIAASGNNSYTDGLNMPACVSNVVSVGATNDSDVVRSTSNSASFLALLAPGQSITSSVPGGGQATYSGTSMSTPHVAGSYAVLRGAAPALSTSALLQALEQTGKPVLDSRNGITKPRIQLDAALKSFALAACFDGLDNDGDGLADFPADPGCRDGLYFENPQCDDGLDNDGDLGIDWDGGPGGAQPDAQCTVPWANAESSSPSYTCGMGPELALVLPLLLWWRRRLIARGA